MGSHGSLQCVRNVLRKHFRSLHCNTQKNAEEARRVRKCNSNCFDFIAVAETTSEKVSQSMRQLQKCKYKMKIAVVLDVRASSGNFIRFCCDDVLQPNCFVLGIDSIACVRSQKSLTYPPRIRKSRMQHKTHPGSWRRWMVMAISVLLIPFKWKFSIFKLQSLWGGFKFCPIGLTF